jgi:hypothetical protein
LAVVVIGLLAVAAVGLGTVQGKGNQTPLTLKKAKKTFFTKKKSNGRFFTKSQSDSKYLAKPRYVDLPSTSFAVDPPASQDFSNGGQAGVHLSESAISAVQASWILPKQFPAGTAEKVNLFWDINNNNGCGIVLQPNALSIANLGAPPQGSSGDITSGFGGLLTAPTAGFTVGTASFTIPGTVDGVQAKPGTMVQFSVFRNPGDTGDTCGSPLVLKGGEVSW